MISDVTSEEGSPTMAFTVRRVVAGAIGAGAVAGSLLIALAPSALAAPPNCTAADLAGTAAGVSAATSAYLFTHPDVNAFFTGLEGSPRDTLRDQVQQYLDANPQVKAELGAIRQPLADLKTRCGGDQGLEVPSP
jgi:hemophore-related protein